MDLTKVISTLSNVENNDVTEITVATNGNISKDCDLYELTYDGVPIETFMTPESWDTIKDLVGGSKDKWCYFGFQPLTKTFIMGFQRCGFLSYKIIANRIANIQSLPDYEGVTFDEIVLINLHNDYPGIVDLYIKENL